MYGDRIMWPTTPVSVKDGPHLDLRPLTAVGQQKPYSVLSLDAG